MVNQLTIPLVPYASCEFDVVTFAAPYWTANFASSYLEAVECGLMDAFLLRAINEERFLAYDAFRPRPIVYGADFSPLAIPVGGGKLFTGDATMGAGSYGYSIIAEGLPPAFQLSVGDYVEVRQSNEIRSLHRIVESVFAGANGRAVLNVRYGLVHRNLSGPCTLHFEKPSCWMSLTPGSAQSSRSWENRTSSFSARESL